MTQYAGEVESDLAERGIDIGDWHRGDISSRRVMTVLRYLPETSALARAMRDHDWTIGQYLAASERNEIHALRVDMRAMMASETMSFDPILSPRTRLEKTEAEQTRAEARGALLALIRGDAALPAGHRHFEIETETGAELPEIEG